MDPEPASGVGSAWSEGVLSEDRADPACDRQAGQAVCDALQRGHRMSQERRDEQLTIRIPKRIREALEAQADQERRSVADVINNLLEEYYSAKPREGARRR